MYIIEFSAVSLKFTGWGIIRRLPQLQQEEVANVLKTDNKYVKTVQILANMKMPELQKITNIKYLAKKKLEFLTFPYVERGQRLFRREDRQEIWDQIEQYKVRFDEAVASLQAKRGEIIEWAKKTLGKGFHEHFYPQNIAAEYSMRLVEHNIDPPNYLIRTSYDLYQRELNYTLQTINQSMRLFEQECIQRITTGLKSIVDNLGENGRIRSNLGATVQSAIAQAIRLRYEGTKVFQETFNSTKELIENMDHAELRSSESARAEVTAKVKSLIERFNQLSQQLEPIAESE